MDVGTAHKYHFKVGDHVRVLLAGPTRTFTISGLVKFGSADNLAGATLAAFDLPTAQRLFDEVGHFDSINVLAQPGTDKATLQRAIAEDLPPGVEVVSGQTVANEQTNSINQALGFFSTALLVFAFISLFVGGFTIFNTFSILVGQRTTRAGPVADRRRQPPPGVPFGAPRGRPARPGRLARRPRAGCPGGRRAGGPAEGLRRHPAHRPPGLRDPHGDRRPRGRHRGDGGVGRQPGPPGRAHPSGGGHGRPPG